jgi:predicted nucleic acid-binding protein
LTVLVDTSVWLRSARGRSREEAEELDALLSRDEVALTGMVLAEVLQGARNVTDFEMLSEKMSALRFLETRPETWTQAARLSFQLARRGVITPLADLIIAAVAIEHDVPVYAVDQHFERVPGLKLHTPLDSKQGS